MKPTKQQAICLKLALWLGEIDPHIELANPSYVEICDEDGNTRVFNPFAPTTEGRAQFAECVIKAATSYGGGIDLFATGVVAGVFSMPKRVGHDKSSDGFVAATLEAIFLAIGGTAEEWADFPMGNAAPAAPVAADESLKDFELALKTIANLDGRTVSIAVAQFCAQQSLERAARRAALTARKAEGKGISND